jgi:hypothetical protein
MSTDHITDIGKKVALLRAFNAWRRDDDGAITKMPDPREIGLAIDAVCDAVDELRKDKERLDSGRIVIGIRNAIGGTIYTVECDLRAHIDAAKEPQS